MSRVDAQKPSPAAASADDRDRLRAAMRNWAGASELAAEPWPDGTTDALLRFADLLLAWNQRINLTAARSVATLIDEHFVDAFALACRLVDPARAVDVGSGGGLPAIPLALLRPALHLTLCEPTAKKQAFLRTAVRELGIGDRVRVRADRAESLAETQPGFDVALSRATFPPAEWLALAPRLVRPGGRIFALAAASAVPVGLRAEVYFGGARALVELTIPEERST